MREVSGAPKRKRHPKAVLSADQGSRVGYGIALRLPVGDRRPPCTQ
jgi:hypothetical protein